MRFLRTGVRDANFFPGEGGLRSLGGDCIGMAVRFLRMGVRV